MSDDLDNMTIGELARTAGVGVETIRFYQRKGLLPEPPKPYGSIRRYGRRDLARLRFIKASQRLGFSLDEIGELLKLEDGAHCVEARAIAERKLEQIREKLAALASMEAALAQLAESCRKRKGNVCCPLIASLHESDVRSRRWARTPPVVLPHRPGRRCSDT